MSGKRVPADPAGATKGNDPSTSRSANEYIAAANAAIDILEKAVYLLPDRNPAVKVVKRVLPAAKQIAGKLPYVAPLAQKAIETFRDKAPNAVSVGVDKVANVMQGAAGAIGERAQAAGDVIKNAFDAKAQEKARREARRVLLDGAGIRMSAQQFLDNWKTQEKLGAQAGNYFDYCGCYAIATYGSAIRKDDYNAFRDIFIGASPNMGKSIRADFIGGGNPDVYADVKYKQHVYVLLYPCPEERLEELRISLITALDADSSYNKPLTAR